MSEAQVVLQAENLTRSFGPRRVLEGVSIEACRGEVLAIMGPSGAGKSVLLKHLIGLLRPESGTVRVFGRDFWALSGREQRLLRRRYGLAFQEGALFDSMSVGENVAFPLMQAGHVDPERIRARVAECLSLVQLPGVEHLPTSALSTGMRRRVGFARAIALEPEILLFDEPTAGLDPVLVTVMSTLIRELHLKLRATTVVVTHDLSSVRLLADRVALLFRGRIVTSAPTDAFFALEHPMVRQFVEARAEGPLTNRDFRTSDAPPAPESPDDSGERSR
ncbi:MAG: ATP-binding cassette domain-containing protein [Myxococcaceae bacterium]